MGVRSRLFFFSFFFLKPELSIKCESAPVCFGGHAYSPRGYSELIQIQLNWLVPAPEKRTVIRTNISLLQVVPPTTHFPGRGHPGEPRWEKWTCCSLFRAHAFVPFSMWALSTPWDPSPLGASCIFRTSCPPKPSWTLAGIQLEETDVFPVAGNRWH